MIVRALVGSAAMAAIFFAQTYSSAHLIELAKASVRAEVAGETAKVSAETPPSPVFVTIEVGGVIRGCRGSLEVRSKSLEEEIALAAQGAAAHDPRYKPLVAREMKNFLVTVTIIHSQVPIVDVDGLRPEDGLVLKSGSRYGIVLPWEGKDPQIRLGWAFKKAGVPTNAPCQLFKLKATRFKG